MSAEPILLVGTKKGVFVGRSDEARREWRFTGPHCSGTWSFYAMAFDNTTRTIYAGGQSNWYGPAVWRSADLGATWEHSSEGLVYGGGPSIEQVWALRPAGGALYAGVDPAGLFRSDDGGVTWSEVVSLRRHPTSAGWHPTNGGLPLHAIEATPDGALWVAISAGGVYHSADAGRTWRECAGAGDRCVHALVAGGTGGTGGTEGTGSAGGTGAPLYQQNHAGVFRSDDGGATWSDRSAGLPSRFGFPLAVHPRDPYTVYVVPLEGGAEGRRYVPEGRMALWRTRDGGATWHQLTAGLPAGRTFLTVLRGALAVDPLSPAGVFAGTPTGHLFGSADEGETWFDVTRGLPPIYSVACAVV